MSLDDLIERVPSTDDAHLDDFADWLYAVKDIAIKFCKSDLIDLVKDAEFFLNANSRRKEYKAKILPHLKAIRRESNYVSEKPAVFVVHGHDDALKSEVARLLEQQNIIPIILHEQTNQGRVLLDKLEQEINRASFAVVLYTKDDMVSSSNGSVWRARQNVVFEHGYLVAKLGRDKVCAIKDEGVELMSDISGVAYISRADSWQIKLLNELKVAGFSVDLNRAKF